MSSQKFSTSRKRKLVKADGSYKKKSKLKEESVLEMEINEEEDVQMETVEAEGGNSSSMASPLEFLESYKNLNGLTMGERKKMFFLQINALKKSQPTDEEIDEISKQIVPQSILEETFKVDFLIQFKRFFSLLDILKGEKIYLIKKIAKEKWFFGDEFGKISAQCLVDDIFANTSYNTRMMILRRLRALFKNEVLADEYFEAVKNQYGLHIAKIMLPCCSQNKILEVVKKYGMLLEDKFILKLVKRDFTFMEQYIENLKSYNHNAYFHHSYTHTFRYIATHHIEIFYRLHKKHDFYVSLNRKGTIMFLKCYKNDVIEKPSQFLSTLDMNYVFRHIKNEFEDFFNNLFPKDIDDLHINSWSTKHAFKAPDKNAWTNATNAIFCCMYPFSKEEKFKMLTKAFEKIYKRSPLESIDFVDSNLMPIVPADEIEKLVKIKSETGDENNWVFFLPVDQSIPLIKKKIKLTSNYEKRGDLLTKLIETCSFNGNDSVALLDVLHYVVTKHRNEEQSVRCAFLDKLLDNFKLELLSKNHWKHINDMLKLFELNKESFWKLSDYRKKYIHFLLIQDLPIKKEIIMHLKLEENDFNIIIEVPEYEKKCLTIMGYVIPEIFKKENLKNAQVNFIQALLNWNKRHPKDPFQMTAYPTYINAIRNMVDEKDFNYYAASILLSLFQSKEYVQVYNLRPIIWKCIQKCHNDGLKTLFKILKYDPNYFVENVKNLLVIPHYDMHRLWHAVLKYEHLKLPQDIIVHSLKEINKKKTKTNKTNFIYAIAHLMPPDDFINAVNKFFPKVAKVSFEENKEYSWEKTDIINSLQHIRSPSVALNTLMKYFLAGDYLINSLNIMYFSVQFVPDTILQSFFNDMSNRAVSVRKHVIFLTAVVCVNENIISFLKRCGEREKNTSIRKFIIKTSIRYFLKNPCEETWQLLVANSNIMDKNDSEAFELFLTHKDVPKDYLPKFIELTWNIFEEAKESCRQQRLDLLQKLSKEVVAVLNPELCYKAIKNALMDTNYDDFIGDFCYKFVFVAADDKELSNRLELIFNLFKEHINKYWYSNKSNIRKSLGNFIRIFCTECINDKSEKIVDKLFFYWQLNLKPQEAFKDYLQLQLTIIYLRVCERENKWQEIAIEFTKYLKEIMDEYGVELLQFVKDAICELINITHYKKDEEFFEFLTHIMKLENSRQGALLVIHLLPNDMSNIKDIQEKHMDILKLLKQNNDAVVQTYFNNYFKSLSNNSSKNCDFTL